MHYIRIYSFSQVRVMRKFSSQEKNLYFFRIVFKMQKKSENLHKFCVCVRTCVYALSFSGTAVANTRHTL